MSLVMNSYVMQARDDELLVYILKSGLPLIFKPSITFSPDFQKEILKYSQLLMNINGKKTVI